MLSTIKNSIINVEPGDVLERAREHDLDVQKIEDFRDLDHHYERIEEIMDDYRSSYYTWSAMGGLTTGIGGFMTSVTFASVDTVSLSLQLYRLSQRFAILNGFDGNDPLQKDKMMNIYFEALGLNAVTQATLKHQLLKASAVAGSRSASDNFVLKLIIKIGKIFGKNFSSKNAGRFIPIVGGLAGATVNYSFAKKTSDRMKKAYARAYFKTWHNED
jgi:hypothetical protein